MRSTLKILLLLFISIGCKDKTDNSTDVGSSPDARGIEITLEVIVKKDDAFSLYYTKDGSTDFTQTPPLWASVKGGNEIQQVVYELPTGILNPQIRLDFGSNEEQEDIVLKKIIFAYNGKTFEPVGANVFDYFRPDPTKCTVDIDEGIIKAKIRNGKRQSPSLYPQEKLLARQIAMLTGN